MQVLNESDLPLKEPTAVAIGLFDGVHTGHIQLVDDIKNKYGLSSLIYTFDKKPRVYQSIFNEYEKMQIFDNLGINKYFVQPFDENFKHINAENFIKRLVNDFNVKHITVGFDFRFGSGAKGNVVLLKEMAPSLNYSLSVIPEKCFGGVKISSSNIRGLISEGDVETAAYQMGRLYFVDGEVVHGNSLGNKLSFPTVNITTDKLVPKYGVYASIISVNEQLYPAVTNIGVKPTIQNSVLPIIESHIINYDGNLYGKNIRVYLVKYLRPETKFDSLDELKAQIEQDVNESAWLLRDLKVYKPLLV